LPRSHTFTDRAERARTLSERYPASGEILTFYAGVSDWQAAHAPVASFQDLLPLLDSLVELAGHTGPSALADAGRALRTEDLEAHLTAHWEAPGRVDGGELFARALLQLYTSGLPDGLDCAWCPGPPLAGCLVTQGDGQALQLVCALCFRRRPALRDRCPSCGEREERLLVTYSAGDYPHLRLRACDSCKNYLLLVDLENDLGAVPEVDEIAGLPLALWAAEAGYRKMQTNIVGI
jgi:FdhE protein